MSHVTQMVFFFSFFPSFLSSLLPSACCTLGGRENTDNLGGGYFISLDLGVFMCQMRKWSRLHEIFLGSRILTESVVERYKLGKCINRVLCVWHGAVYMDSMFCSVTSFNQAEGRNGAAFPIIP